MTGHLVFQSCPPLTMLESPALEILVIFDPFYRLDAARDRETGGTGLGLAIVKTCIESCGGSVVARNRSTGGLEVEFQIPACHSSERSKLAPADD